MTKTIVTDEQLMEMIDKGMNAQQIIEKADIKMYTLKRRYTNLMIAQKKFFEIPGLIQAKDEISFKATGATVGKSILEEYGFKSGDRFKVSFNGKKDKTITLKQMK